MSGIGLIEDKSLQDALSAAYQSAEAGRVARTAEALFNKLTSSGWTKDTLCRFINGWRSTHGTALFVSGLMIRLHRLANKEMGEQSRNLLCQAAGEVGEIIPEDTGVSDTPHHQLFAQFADEIVGSDDWKLDRYTNPACDQFRSFVQEQRLSGPYQEAILTTAASENWNTGEYTYFAGMVQRWMTEKLGIASDKAKTASAYVVVHSGDTELGHFRHAIKAWQLFCRATGEPADPVLAKTVFERYIKAIGVAYEELLSTLR